MFKADTNIAIIIIVCVCPVESAGGGAPPVPFHWVGLWLIIERGSNRISPGEFVVSEKVIDE